MVGGYRDRGDIVERHGGREIKRINIIRGQDYDKKERRIRNMRRRNIMKKSNHRRIRNMRWRKNMRKSNTIGTKIKNKCYTRRKNDIQKNNMRRRSKIKKSYNDGK